MKQSNLRSIPGFFGYFIGRDGSVWSRRHWQSDRLKQLQTRTNSEGYTTVSLQNKHRKSVPCPVHRLMLLTFVGQPVPGQECRHLNGKRCDNRLENLVWGTSTENNRDRITHGTIPRGDSHPRSKLTETIVIELRRAFHNGTYHIPTMAKRYGVNCTGISNAIRGVTWKHLPNAATGRLPMWSPTRKQASDNKRIVTLLCPHCGANIAYVRPPSTYKGNQSAEKRRKAEERKKASKR